MPELPEVETVRRGLSPAMVGARILKVDVRRSNLRFPFPERFAERLTGRRIEALSRRAKYLLADLDDGAALIMHLGMSGSFRVIWAQDPSGETPGAFHHPRDSSAAHDHVVFHLTGGTRVVYNDPRRFGFMDLAARADLESHKLFRDLGVEPLGNQFGPQTLAHAFAGRKSPLKPALLDQSAVAGLGNIYVCEALHRAGLSPRKPASRLARRDKAPTPAAIRLAQCVRDVLEEAVAAGGSSLRDHRATDGSLGYFQHNFRVYDREGEACPRPGCSGRVRRIVQSGRSTFYCAACQT